MCKFHEFESSSAISLMPRDSYFLDAGKTRGRDLRKPCEAITERGESIRYCCKEPERLKMACEENEWRCHSCGMVPRENSMVVVGGRAHYEAAVASG
ncbi:hypothetical protein ARSEF1564_003835 [Beauveria bassiana]